MLRAGNDLVYPVPRKASRPAVYVGTKPLKAARYCKAAGTGVRSFTRSYELFHHMTVVLIYAVIYYYDGHKDVVLLILAIF